MAENLDSFTREELIERISDLKRQLNNGKYGLFFDRKATPEDVVKLCENNIPILERVVFKDIEKGGKEHLIIEGDNFHVLTSLNMINPSEGLIDLIYIDPPYNTGSEDFIYNDRLVDREDGFKHTKWLNFIEKRLILARNILKDDGVIFVSIDDNEQANLKILMDSIFGVQNFLACLVINSAPAGTQSAVDFAIQHSYCLAYRKTEDFAVCFQMLSEEELSKKYSQKDEHGYYYIERLWKRGIGGRMDDVPTLHFPIFYNEKTRKIILDDEYNEENLDDLVKIIPYQTAGVLGRWTWSRAKMRSERNKLIVVKVAGEWRLHKKVYLDEEKGKKPYTIIGSKIGRTELGSLELKNVLGKKAFDYPKFSGFISYLINTHLNKDAKILDFFAGSGTTAQAVLEMNNNDGGNRQFILCTNNEGSIMDEVCYPRIKTVVTGQRVDGTKYSDGIPATVRYLKTAFVKDDSSKDQAKYNLVEKVNSLLCVVEETFVELEKGTDYYVYSNLNSSKVMGLFFDYFNESTFDKMMSKLEHFKNNEIIIYVFSLDNSVDSYIEKLIKDKLPEASIKPIPSKIYEIYKKIMEEMRRDF